MTDHDPDTRSEMGVPPVDPPQIELDTPPPSWPKVVGIISIVFGALGLTCNAFTIVAGAVFMPMGAEAMMETLGTSEPPPSMVMQPLDWVAVTVGLAVAALLLIAGILTASRSASGRTLHIGYGFVGILTTALGMFLQYTKFQTTSRWVEENVSDAAMAQSMSNEIGLYIGLAMGALFGLAYPLFCIFWFGAMGKRPEAGKPEVL